MKRIIKKLNLPQWFGRRFKIILGSAIVAVFVVGWGLFATYYVTGWNPLNSVKAFKADNTEISRLVKSYLSDCRNEKCLQEKLREITSKHGAATAIDSLEYYDETVADRPKADSHLLAHEIGRQAAETFGVSGDVFLSCPQIYNYGCQHGFFEKALSKVDTPKQAIESICGKLEGDTRYSRKFQSYCYHGVGHGLMMAQAYDLPAALAICDLLNSKLAQEGCWQGLFMENVNGSMRGEARDEAFSKDDPLAPCSKVDAKYHRECYIVHAPYLLVFYKNDTKSAANACLKAAEGDITPCFEGIGLLVTNRGWQELLLPPANNNTSELEPRAWQICQEFPSDYVSLCVRGSVIQIVNASAKNMDSAVKFCELVAQQYSALCFENIGSTLRGDATNPQSVKDKCLAISNTGGQAACLRGAGL